MNTNSEHILDNKWSRKSIHSLTPFTLIDYPDKTSCVLWFAGCNMRCVYCYNPEIVKGKGKYNFYDIRDFLTSRVGLLDGVVLSGGECLMHDSVIDMLIAIKKMGFLVKIDTNGSKHDTLKYLIDHLLIDYVSLDFKALPHKFYEITGSDFYDHFVRSLSILQHATIDFEVRTTIHSSLFTKTDLESMIEILSSFGYQGKYFLQYFRPGMGTLGDIGDSSFEPNLKEINGKGMEVIFR